MRNQIFGLRFYTRCSRKAMFPDEMSWGIPQNQQLMLIVRHVWRVSAGLAAFALECKLDIHLMRQCIDPSNAAFGKALFDVSLYRKFSDVGCRWRSSDRVNIIRFCHLLEKDQLASKMLVSVNVVSQARGLMLKEDTNRDTTLITVPNSNGNKGGKRYPQRHQGKKGHQRHVGMKVHTCIDVDAIPEQATVGAAVNVDDVTQAAVLVHGGVRCFC